MFIFDLLDYSKLMRLGVVNQNRRREIESEIQIRSSIPVRFGIQRRNRVDDRDFNIKSIIFDLKSIYFD